MSNADPSAPTASAAPARPTGWRSRARRLRARTRASADALWRGFDQLVGQHAPWAGSRYAVVIGWLLTRLVMVLLLLGLERTILNDVRYYAAGISEVGSASPVSAVLREYPTPVLGLLALPWLASFSSIDAYVALFVVLMLALDALYTWLLARRRAARGDGSSTAVTLWLVAGPALGPLALTRFDVVPGMLAGVAVLYLTTRPRLSGALVTLGAAIKLWPVLLLPALLGPRRTRVPVLVGAVGCGIVVLAASLVTGGWDRLLSPLGYQSDRGLQVESVAALPLMVVWSVAHGQWQITFTKFITSEITGPGDTVMLLLVNLATVAAVALMATLWWRGWRAGRSFTPAGIGWVMLTCTALFIVTNKVFSPQYLLWLTPIVVAILACTRTTDTGARRFAVLLVLVGVVTQVVYPNAYVLVTEMSWGNPIGVGLLLVRDVGLVGLTWYAARRAWLATARVPAG